MQANYQEIERRVLLSEGGYTNDPRDPGGPTNWGITLGDARRYWNANATAEDVRNMPKQVADQIYHAKYWDAVGGDELPSGVDYAVFDYGVNSGVSRALRVLDSLHEPNAVQLVHAICDERLAFLRRLPTWDHFGAGWSRRVASVRLYADHLASQATGEAPTHPGAPEGSAKAYPDPNAPQGANVPKENPQGSSVVHPSEAPATPMAPPAKTHWWAPWAVLGLGGSGTASWLQQANDLAAQAGTAKDNLEHLGSAGLWHGALGILKWTIHHPLFLVPAVAIGLAAWLWEEHKRNKKELKCSQPSPPLPPS